MTVHVSRFLAREFKKSISSILLSALLILLVMSQSWETAPYARAAVRRPAFGYGSNVADLANAPRLAEMGFGWMKGFVGWDGLEPRPDEYDWTDLSKAVASARENRLGLLLRIDRAPEWARPDNLDPSAPPALAYLDEWGEMLENLARRGRGRVAAYEIWNEPNLASEWGGRAPEPAYYVRMLAIAYQRIKSGDPGARVISAGLAPTQGDGGAAADNLTYLRRMYELGAGGYFDILGSHSYGFGNVPQADPLTEASFRSVELERKLMLEFGDGLKPVWITETGWPAEPGAIGLGACRDRPPVQEMLWQSVDPELQGRYMAQAYQLAYESWPWVDAVFVFNLDFAAAPWYSDPCETMKLYSLLGPDGAPRAAFDSLKQMPKPGGGS